MSNAASKKVPAKVYFFSRAINTEGDGRLGECTLTRLCYLGRKRLPRPSVLDLLPDIGSGVSLLDEATFSLES
jgi:hypothetical protein